MTRAYFDTTAFFAALDAQRQARRITWKTVAAEAGVSASTLTRMAQGKRPDVDGFAALTAWAGLDADAYFRQVREERDEPETLAMISTYLRSDPHLTGTSAAALDDLVKAAYNRLRED